jgi:uncharacterized membrane protein
MELIVKTYPLGILIVIGALLRFVGLATLPPWTDECATAVFSLGHSFLTVPLNQIITTDTLLTPLKYQPITTWGQVVDRLFSESTHPPLYFILMHGWLRLFPATEPWISPWLSLWGLRSLSALFGIATIPVGYGLSWLTFRSRPLALLTAALFTVSPFGLFLARQARHYTLIILLAMVSLMFLVRAIQAVRGQAVRGQGKLPRWFGLAWTGINGLGMMTHYFFALVLGIEALVLLGFVVMELRRRPFRPWISPWPQLCGAVLGTFATTIVWLPTIVQLQNTPLTHWVYDGDPRSAWIDPLLRLVLWLMSMVFALPSDLSQVPFWCIVVMGVISLGILAALGPRLVQGLATQYHNPNHRLGLQILGGYTLVTLFVFLALTYGLEMDLTLAHRFQFVYFPGLIVILAVALAFHSQRLIRWVLALGLVGSLMVMTNLTYLQNHRPDLLVPIIQSGSQAPILIATGHIHHGQTGRMMGLAWAFRHLPASEQPQFFLAHWGGYDQAVATLRQQVRQVAVTSGPLDVWLVDILNKIELEVERCPADPEYGGRIGEHRYQLYRCR